MRILTTLTIGTAALLTSVPLAAAVSPRPAYMLSMQLRDGERVVGSPRLRVTAGEMATVSIGDLSGNHYRVCVTAMPNAAGKVAISSNVDVVSLGRHGTASPRLVIGYGERAVMAIAADDGAGKPFRVDVTVRKAA